MTLIQESKPGLILVFSNAIYTKCMGHKSNHVMGTMAQCLLGTALVMSSTGVITNT